MRRLRLPLAALLITVSLAGCGIRGDLERPAPVWGPDNRTEDERAHEAEDAGETRR